MASDYVFSSCLDVGLSFGKVPRSYIYLYHLHILHLFAKGCLLSSVTSLLNDWLFFLLKTS